MNILKRGSQNKLSNKPNLINTIPLFIKLSVFFISLLSYIIYSQSINYEYTLDDRIYTINNEATSAGLERLTDLFLYGSLNFFTLQPTNSGTYRPITLISFAAEYELFNKFDPQISHFINVILYSLLILILGFVLLKLFQKRNISLTLALMVLILFATHPLHIEVVASVKSRDILLAGVFVFASLFLWIRSFENGKSKYIALSVLLFFLALLAKEDSITFVAIFFLIGYYFKRLTLLTSFKKTIPYIVVSILYLAIRFSVLEQSDNEGVNSILNNIIYATEGNERFATNLSVWLLYLRLIIYPYPLSWDYSYNEIPIVSLSNIEPYISMIIFTFLIVVAVISLKSRNIIGFGILFYLVTFSIYSNVFPSITIGSTLAERFVFIPILGLIISFVFLLSFLMNKLNYLNPKLITPSIILIISVMFTLYDFSQIKNWKDNYTLFESGVKSSPNSWRTHAYYASSLKEQALNILRENNDGLINQQKARDLLVTAANEYEKSISIIDQKARLSTNHIELGNIYLLINDTTAAIIAYNNALKDNPNSSQALTNLAMTLYWHKDFEQSLNYFNRLIKLNPKNPGSILETMSRCYIHIGDYSNALETLEKSLSINSNNLKLTVLLHLSQILNNASKVEYYQRLISESNP